MASDASVRRRRDSAPSGAVPPAKYGADVWDLWLAWLGVPASERAGLDLAGLRALAKTRNLV